MINNYNDFKECMSVGRPSAEPKKKEELLFFKSLRPYTYGQYNERYQKEKRELENISKRR